MLDRAYELPGSCIPPIAFQAVTDLMENANVSVDLAATNVLSTMAGATHGSANIEAVPGMTLPLSLLCEAVAGSGSGKTVCQTKLMEGFRRFDAEMSEQFAAEMVFYQSELDAFEAARKGILKKIKKMAEDEDGAHHEHCTELIEHDKSRPSPPTLPRSYVNDATFAGLISAMGRWPNVSYVNDEASFLIENRLGDVISFIHSCNSGTSVNQETGRSRVRIFEPRLNMLIQMQPSVFDRMHQQYGDRLADEGFYARAISCYSIPRLPGAGARNSQSWSGIELFNERCYELLKASVGDDGKPVPKKTLRFDAEAQSVFDQERARVNSLRQPGGCLQAFPALAAKIPENIAKIAAIFHTFDKQEGGITSSTLRNAMAIYGWYIDEHIRIFSSPPAPPQEYEDALKLMVWFANYVRTHGKLFMPRNFLLQNGPRATRAVVRLRAALLFLWQRGVLWEQVNAGSDVMYVYLRQEQFQPQHIYHWCGSNPGFPM